LAEVVRIPIIRPIESSKQQTEGTVVRESQLELAHGLGITLIGFARGKRMNVHANDWRLVSNG
jgi:formate dehydrogenase assembly factor FdhD